MFARSLARVLVCSIASLSLARSLKRSLARTLTRSLISSLARYILAHDCLPLAVSLSCARSKCLVAHSLMYSHAQLLSALSLARSYDRPLAHIIAGSVTLSRSNTPSLTCSIVCSYACSLICSLDRSLTHICSICSMLLSSTF